MAASNLSFSQLKVILVPVEPPPKPILMPNFSNSFSKSSGVFVDVPVFIAEAVISAVPAGYTLPSSNKRPPSIFNCTITRGVSSK